MQKEVKGTVIAVCKWQISYTSVSFAVKFHYIRTQGNQKKLQILNTNLLIKLVEFGHRFESMSPVKTSA